MERNTGQVGLASAACTSIKAVNAEIAAISQHQDPASTGAAAINKAIVLELAKQISTIGNPLDALQSGTFAPGNLNDDTGKGNTCDTQDDPVGCIFTENLLVDDATAAEIEAAVGGTAPSGASSAAVVAPAATSTRVQVETTAAACAAPVTVTAVAAAVASSPAAAVASASAALDFGTCTDPAIVFGPGFDGRNQNSFEPANKASFNHGSALNIGVITSFICGQLQSACKAGADAISACTAGQTAAAAQTGQAAADAFNAALGVSAGAASTVAASSVAASSVASPVAASTAAASTAAASTAAASTAAASTAAASTAAASTAAASTAAASTAAAAASPATTTTAAVSGTNVQTFAGTLGGAAPPVIFTAGAARPFAVDGTTDINKGAAIMRSCSVQHNNCADAANSGALAGGVGQCDAQLSACNAAGGV